MKNNLVDVDSDRILAALKIRESKGYQPISPDLEQKFDQLKEIAQKKQYEKIPAEFLGHLFKNEQAFFRPHLENIEVGITSQDVLNEVLGLMTGAYERVYESLDQKNTEKDWIINHPHEKVCEKSKLEISSYEMNAMEEKWFKNANDYKEIAISKAINQILREEKNPCISLDNFKTQLDRMIGSGTYDELMKRGKKISEEEKSGTGRKVQFRPYREIAYQLYQSSIENSVEKSRKLKLEQEEMSVLSAKYQMLPEVSRQDMLTSDEMKYSVAVGRRFSSRAEYMAQKEGIQTPLSIAKIHEPSQKNQLSLLPEFCKKLGFTLTLDAHTHLTVKNKQNHSIMAVEPHQISAIEPHFSQTYPDDHAKAEILVKMIVQQNGGFPPECVEITHATPSLEAAIREEAQKQGIKNFKNDSSLLKSFSENNNNMNHHDPKPF